VNNCCRLAKVRARAMATLANCLLYLPRAFLSSLPFQCSWLGFFNSIGPYHTLAIDVMDVAVREVMRAWL
jgi:hypothetical protein